MLILCVIFAQKTHNLLACITIDGIYVKQSVKPVLYDKQQLCMQFTVIEMYLK